VIRDGLENVRRERPETRTGNQSFSRDHVGDARGRVVGRSAKLRRGRDFACRGARSPQCGWEVVHVEVDEMVAEDQILEVDDA
jgi:hypothetical protein